MIIRSRTLKRWLQANFTKGQLEDIVNHGVDAGWKGLTYNSETSQLYMKFKEEIWESLYEEAESVGEKNVFAMLAQGRLAEVSCASEVENLLVWWVVESLARDLTEGA